MICHERLRPAAFISLQPQAEPHRWSLALEERMCVGREGPAFMFGGVGLAAGVQALELTCERRLIWATAQFTARAARGTIVDLEVSTLARGNAVTQARVVGSVGATEIFHVAGALGDRQTPFKGQWAKPPAVPAADDCPHTPERAGEGNGLHAQFDVRLARGRFGFAFDGEPPSPDGRLSVWLKFKNGTQIDAEALAVLSDYIPTGIGNAVGRHVAGSSLDNTIRIHRVVPTTWVLCDIQIEGVQRGFSHGVIDLYAEDGTLLASGSQSAIIRDSD